MNDLATVMADAADKMQKSCAMLKEQFVGLRTGKASPALVENVQVVYYGTPTRLRDLAGIATPEARLIVISPYDPSALHEIEKAILAANVGVTPVSDGRVVRVPIPEMSEERRKEIVKLARRHAEDARVAVRNVRRDANEMIKKLQKDGTISEDERDHALVTTQKNTDESIAQIDAHLKTKEAEIMEV